MKLSYETRIGILAAVTLILLVFGYKFLKGNNLLDHNKTYLLYFDNVAQLEPSSPVFTRGIKVGTVLKIQLAEDNPYKVVVFIDIKNDIHLPKNSVAVLVSTGLIGGKAIDLRFDHHCTDDCIPNNGTIDTKVESILSSMLPKSELDEYIQSAGTSIQHALDSTGTNQELNNMAHDLKSTLHNLNLLTNQLHIVLLDNNQQINGTMKNLNTLSASLASNTKNIDQSLTNLQTVTAQLKQADIGKIANHADETIQSLQKTAQEATNSMHKVNELIGQIQNGNGTASKLIKDPALYNNLESTAKSLDKLLNDLRLYPNRYVHFSVFPAKKQMAAEQPSQEKK